MRSVTGVIIVVAALAASPASASAIYRCAGSAGEVMFADLPCPDGREQSTQPTVTLDMTLRPDERSTLQRLQRERAARAPIERSRIDSTAVSRALIQAERRCTAAQAALDRVRATKRRGYRASSAAALDARERDYQARRERDCAGYAR